VNVKLLYQDARCDDKDYEGGVEEFSWP